MAMSITRSSSVCTDHNEEYLMVCEKCSCFVCLTCISSQHKGHDHCKIDTAADKTRLRFQKQVDEYDTKLSSFKRDKETIKAAKDAESATPVSIKSRLEYLSSVLPGKLEQTAKKMEEVCNKNKQERLDLINNKETTINVQMTTIEANKYRLEKLMTSKPETVIRAGFKFKQAESRTTESCTIQPLKFTPGSLDQATIESIFGDIVSTTLGSDKVQGNSVPQEEEHDSDENSSDFQSSAAQVKSDAGISQELSLKSLDASGSPVFSICPERNGDMLIKRGQYLIKLNSEGTECFKRNFTTDIAGMVLDQSNNRILFVSRKRQCVQVITLPEVEVSELFKCSGKTLHICLTADREILVSTVDEVDIATTYDSKRILTKFNNDGIPIKEAQYDRFGDHLFVIPERIRANRSGTMIVVFNRTSDSNSMARQGSPLATGGHLVVLDGNLDLKYRFLGKDMLLPATVKFNPATSDTKLVVNDMDFDRNDNIVLVDAYTKSIQILDPNNCKPIRFLLSDIVTPTSVAYNNYNKTVWVGYKDGKVQIIKIIK